jgi:hypothetical protein
MLLLQGISKRFSGLAALSQVSFSAEEGDQGVIAQRRGNHLVQYHYGSSSSEDPSLFLARKSMERNLKKSLDWAYREHFSRRTCSRASLFWKMSC